MLLLIVEIDRTIWGCKSKGNCLHAHKGYVTIRYRGYKKQKMENTRAQLLERLQTANNILVTVSSSPSVDQLSAAIGLTLMLNRVGKQATAVFSGKVPSTIEFLQPEKTIEKNTDSLRDFIIALDKSKADKLRYKVEDDHVRIFITPYRTALSEKDLKFSQGDFNIEVVIALGVKDQKDLDRAITAHGRILHDATTISVTNGEPSSLGSIDWDDTQASGLSEMVAGLASELGPNSLDGQVSTALLTGIVAQTERFRNARTLPATMSIASALMAAGANQQLIASKLEQAMPEKPVSKASSKKQDSQDAPEPETPQEDPSALRIAHEEEALPDTVIFNEPAEPEAPTGPQIGRAKALSDDAKEPVPSAIKAGRGLVLEPPTMGSKLTANTEPEHLDPATDPLGVKQDESPLLSRAAEEPVPSELPPLQLPEEEVAEPEPVIIPEEPELPIAEQADTGEQTLTDLEAAVRDSYSEPVNPQPFNIPAAEPITEIQALPVENAGGISDARDAVSDALASIGASEQPLPPITALNAQPFDINDQLGNQAAEPAFTLPAADPVQPLDIPEFIPPADEPVPAANPIPDFVLPEAPTQLPQDIPSPVVDPTAPPAVPPPFMPGVTDFGGQLPPIPPAQDAANPQQPPAAGNTGNPFNLPPA